MRALTLACVLCVVAAVPAAADEFEPYRPGATAVTYDARVPEGARASVVSFGLGGRTVVSLLVSGLQPRAHYGAHVHVRPCGPTGAEAGPHFQNVVDPVSPSVDPAYANPRNEVWLDLTTDARGMALSSAQVWWRFGDRPAGSVVLHAHHTATAPGEAGMAGPRLACLTADFA
ncbi:superoxide dismutase [Actinokineospora sp. 24-640]